MPSGLGNYLAIALSSMAVYLFLLIAIRLLAATSCPSCRWWI